MQIVYKDGSEFKLEYDDEKHSYVVDGNKIPSVTKVIDSCFPKYLVDWAVQEGADFFLQSLEPYRKPDPATFIIPQRVVEHIHQGEGALDQKETLFLMMDQVVKEKV